MIVPTVAAMLLAFGGMLALWRRSSALRSESRAREIVRACLADQMKYEASHAQRQLLRLRHTKARPLRGHGSYDLDQRIESVEIRARTAFAAQGKEPIGCLSIIVAEVVRAQTAEGD